MDCSRPSSVTIPATDGFPLAASLFSCRHGDALGTLLVAGAVGNPRCNYADFARQMAAQGWNVITFDYRGMGESRAPRQSAAACTMLDWGEKDLAGVIDWAKNQLRPRRLVLIGHSIGGQIAALAPNHGALDAFVGVAAQRGYWRYWPGLSKFVFYSFFRVAVPLCLKLRRYLPLEWVGLESLPAGAARDWARWGVCRDYLDSRGNSLESRFSRFTTPVLALSFSDDLSLAPEKAVTELFSRHYTAAPVTRWHVCPEEFGVQWLGHSGFFRPELCPKQLWQEMVDWILSTCPMPLAA